MSTSLVERVRPLFPLAMRERLWLAGYRATLAVLAPLNALLARTRRGRRYPNSVLHVSYMVHVPHDTVRILRRAGMKADYLAVGTSPVWDKSDYRMDLSRWPHVQAWREFRFFWDVEAHYEIVHSHFMITMSYSGWELPILKRMGRRLVVHYRGCEIRNREQNMALHPAVNICQECDYAAVACTHRMVLARRALAGRHGDRFLVTTPDLLDFAPEAEYLPFFAPTDDALQEAPAPRQRDRARPLRIVHVTVHPGIEGTRHIQAAVDTLIAKGHRIEFVALSCVPHREALAALRDADLAVGKMKMGYYANAQIESMAQGVPTVTYVRPEFMTEELRNSGFIFATLDTLETTLEYYVTHPEALEEKRRLARDSVLELHDNDRIASRLIALYGDVARGLRSESSL